jgi:uncharacterized membrane protein YwaF
VGRAFSLQPPSGGFPGKCTLPFISIDTALVFGGIAPLRPGAVWRAYGGLLGYAALVGAFNAIFHTNYMYLCTRPKNASVLDAFGPWPVYLVQAAGLALLLYFLLWLPTRNQTKRY